MGGTAGWTAQVLMACCIVLCVASEIEAVDPVTLVVLAWTVEHPDTLRVCASAALATEDARLVVVQDGGQKDYSGTKISGQDACATFDFPAPGAGVENTYKLFTVYEDGAPAQQGLVTFTLMGEEITCGGSKFVRITSGLINASSEAFACLPDLNVCYSSAQVEVPPLICLEGLDTDNNPDLLLYVPASVFPLSSVNATDPFVATSLEYGELTATATLTTSGLASITELLSRVEGEESTLRASECDGGSNTCTLDPFSSASSNYELCGVSGDSDTSLVTGFGATTFQDVMLKVDTTTVPINFHFKRPPGDGMYEVYHGLDSTVASGPSTLDCSRVPEDGFCYGVVIEDSAYVGVSYGSKANAVVAPVPTASLHKFRTKLRN